MYMQISQRIIFWLVHSQVASSDKPCCIERTTHYIFTSMSLTFGTKQFKS